LTKVFDVWADVKAPYNRRPQASQVDPYCINTHQLAIVDSTGFDTAETL